MSDPRWFTLLPAAIVAAAGPAHATTYLSTQAAQRLMFPAASAFADRSVTFTPEQRKAIARASGVAVHEKGQAIWEARSPAGRLGWFIVDRVLGKHELITYAVALDPTGAIRDVEILDYRETYGGEIRNEHWRRQFVGKRQGAALKLDGDIRNISGATLSCRHVTDGIKRLLATYDLLLKSA
jgi:Na+-transporting NADH:ubiquinone oxidoreductase subunit C